MGLLSAFNPSNWGQREYAEYNGPPVPVVEDDGNIPGASDTKQLSIQTCADMCSGIHVAAAGVAAGTLMNVYQYAVPVVESVMAVPEPMANLALQEIANGVPSTAQSVSTAAAIADMPIVRILASGFKLVHRSYRWYKLRQINAGRDNSSAILSAAALHTAAHWLAPVNFTLKGVLLLKCYLEIQKKTQEVTQAYEDVKTAFSGVVQQNGSFTDKVRRIATCSFVLLKRTFEFAMLLEDVRLLSKLNNPAEFTFCVELTCNINEYSEEAFALLATLTGQDTETLREQLNTIRNRVQEYVDEAREMVQTVVDTADELVQTAVATAEEIAQTTVAVGQELAGGALALAESIEEDPHYFMNEGQIEIPELPGAVEAIETVIEATGLLVEDALDLVQESMQTIGDESANRIEENRDYFIGEEPIEIPFLTDAVEGVALMVTDVASSFFNFWGDMLDED